MNLIEKLKIIGQSLISAKQTTEQISDEAMKPGDPAFQVESLSGVANGGLVEQITFKRKIFPGCGCICHDAKDIAGIDYKGNLTCKKHFYRCLRCRRPLSPKTVKAIKGYAYCEWCSFVKKITFRG